MVETEAHRGIGRLQEESWNCLSSQRKGGRYGPNSGKSCLHQLPSSPQDHWNRDLLVRSVPVPTGLQLCQPQSVSLKQDWYAQRWNSIFACPGLGNTADFLVSLPLCKLANYGLRYLELCPYKALKKLVQALWMEDVCGSDCILPAAGTLFMCLPHLVQVTMWPHSSRTQLMGESM